MAVPQHTPEPDPCLVCGRPARGTVIRHEPVNSEGWLRIVKVYVHADWTQHRVAVAGVFAGREAGRRALLDATARLVAEGKK